MLSTWCLWKWLPWVIDHQNCMLVCFNLQYAHNHFSKKKKAGKNAHFTFSVEVLRYLWCACRIKMVLQTIFCLFNGPLVKSRAEGLVNWCQSSPWCAAYKHWAQLPCQLSLLCRYLHLCRQQSEHAVFSFTFFLCFSLSCCFFASSYSFSPMNLISDRVGSVMFPRTSSELE